MLKNSDVAPRIHAIGRPGFTAHAPETIGRTRPSEPCGESLNGNAVATTRRRTDLVVGQLLGLGNEDGAADFTLGVRKQVSVVLDHLVDCKAETET